MEVYVFKGLKEEIVKVLNKENNTNYNLDDIELMEFDRLGVNITTTKGYSYRIFGSNIWY